MQKQIMLSLAVLASLGCLPVQAVTIEVSERALDQGWMDAGQAKRTFADAPRFVQSYLDNLLTLFKHLKFKVGLSELDIAPIAPSGGRNKTVSIDPEQIKAGYQLLEDLNRAQAEVAAGQRGQLSAAEFTPPLDFVKQLLNGLLNQ